MLEKRKNFQVKISSWFDGRKVNTNKKVQGMNLGWHDIRILKRKDICITFVAQISRIMEWKDEIFVRFHSQSQIKDGIKDPQQH